MMGKYRFNGPHEDQFKPITQPEKLSDWLIFLILKFWEHRNWSLRSPVRGEYRFEIGKKSKKMGEVVFVETTSPVFLSPGLGVRWPTTDPVS